MELEVPVSEHVSADAEEVDLEGAGADWVEDSLEGAGAGLEEAGACFDIVDWEETGLETDGACLGAGAGLEETELDGADFEADFEADSTDFDRESWEPCFSNTANKEAILLGPDGGTGEEEGGVTRLGGGVWIAGGVEDWTDLEDIDFTDSVDWTGLEDIGFTDSVDWTDLGDWIGLGDGDEADGEDSEDWMDFSGRWAVEGEGLPALSLYR